MPRPQSSTAANDGKNKSKKVGGIETPHPHDVLSGRGGASNHHRGNAIYRTVIERNKAAYKAAPKQHKQSYAIAIIDAVQAQDPPGRFLVRDKVDKLWYEVGRKKAIDKAAQALREKVHKARQVPVEDIPVEFHHLLREEAEGEDGAAPAAAAAAAAAATVVAVEEPTGGVARVVSSSQQAGKKRKGAPSPSEAYANARYVSDRASSTVSSSAGAGAGAGAGATAAEGAAQEKLPEPKRIRLDSRFFFGAGSRRTSSAATSEGGGGATPRSPTEWTGRFSRTGSLADEQQQARSSLEEPKLKSDNPSICVETALESGPSLFNFFSTLGFSRRHLDVGAAADDDEEDDGGRHAASLAGAVPAATGAADRCSSADVAAGMPGQDGKQRRKSSKGPRTAATAAARSVVESAVEEQEAALDSKPPALRKTTLSADVSSFLPSFLERGATAVLEHIHGPSGAEAEEEAPPPPTTTAGAAAAAATTAPGTAGDGTALLPASSLGSLTSLGRALSDFLGGMVSSGGTWLSGGGSSGGGGGGTKDDDGWKDKWVGGSPRRDGGGSNSGGGSGSMRPSSILVGSPRPAALGKNDRVLTLMRDDDDDNEDPTLARLRALPLPPLPRTGGGGARG